MNVTENPSQRLEEARELFILEWGRMGTSWGINRTMAQIQSLLYITGEHLTMDQIVERLQISRGNASMNLRELMAWGMVRRFRRPGDRRDVYLAEHDVWHMFSRVVRERKRREIDPTVTALCECLNLVNTESEGEPTRLYRERIQALLDVFGLMEVVFRQIFTDDDGLKEAVEEGVRFFKRTPSRE